MYRGCPELCVCLFTVCVLHRVYILTGGKRCPGGWVLLLILDETFPGQSSSTALLLSPP